MQAAYASLFALAAASFLLHLSWLFTLAVALFLALLLLQAFTSPPPAPAEVDADHAQPAAPPQSIVVTQGADFGSNYLSTLLGTLSAMEAYEKTPSSSFKRDYSESRDKRVLDRLDRISKRLDKIEHAGGGDHGPVHLGGRHGGH
ncbi:MAG: hypothetical protein V1787_04200 [Candidatus Micrarchaeota archaeon]